MSGMLAFLRPRGAAAAPSPPVAPVEVPSPAGASGRGDVEEQQQQGQRRQPPRASARAAGAAPPPPRGAALGAGAGASVARMHLMGEVVGCRGFPAGKAYCAEWWLAAGSEWALEAGEVRGRTQAAFSGPADVAAPQRGALCAWGHPIQVCYVTPTMQGWPKLCVAIRSVDPDGGLWPTPASGTEAPVAYGVAPLPQTPGEHDVEIQCWQPCDRSTRASDEAFAFFTGLRPELNDANTALVADRAGAFARGMVTHGVGTVVARVTVLTRDIENARMFAAAPWHRAKGAVATRPAGDADADSDSDGEVRVPPGLSLDGPMDDRERARREALFEARALRVASDASITGPPDIVIHPTSATVPAGTLLTLRVAAGGQPPLAYQWERDGQVLEGQTERFMRIKVRRIGEYTCVVRNLLGAVRSKGAKVALSAAAGDEGVFARLNRLLANSERRIRQLFGKYDADETGTLERDELRNFMRELLPGATRPELRYLQALMDVDGDGSLSFLELVQSIRTCRTLADAASGRRGVGQTNARFSRVMGKLVASVAGTGGGSQDLKAVFDRYDKDNSGTLDQRELSKLLREVTKPENNDELRFLIASVLHTADVDGNGEIGFGELERVVRRITLKDVQLPLPEGRQPVERAYGPVA